MKRAVFAILLTLSFSPELFAQTHIGPVASSLGGAGRASVSPLEVAPLNPAALTQLRGYFFGVEYETNYNRTDMAPGFFVGVTDASDDVIFPGALGYYKTKTVLKGVEADLQDIQLGFGGFLFNKVSMGVSLHRIMVKPLIGDDVAENNATLALLVTPTENIGISLIGYDVMDSKELKISPVSALGLNFVYPDVIRLALDATYNQKDNERKAAAWCVGLESLMTGGFRLRTGHQWDNYRSVLTGTAGFGWQGPRLSVDYGYQKNLSRDEYRHSFDLRLEL